MTCIFPCWGCLRGSGQEELVRAVSEGQGSPLPAPVAPEVRLLMSHAACACRRSRRCS